MKHPSISIGLLFALSFFVINSTNAQQDSKLSKYLPNYSTDDPSALYNGIPNITIPLYTLEGKGVSVPVSLSYDASGITIAQEATSVGLGWVLNAGGHIIQEVRDWDDYLPGKTRVQDPDSAWSIDYTQTYGWRNEYDNLPDNFFYSCNGLSGKFILSPDLTECLEIPHSNTKITISSAKDSFTITSEDGVQYIFSLSQLVWKNQNEVESRIYVLENIYSPQCDTIDFTYYDAEYLKTIPKTVIDGITEEAFRTTDTKEMPMNLVTEISLRGGATIKFELGNKREDCYSTTDTIPRYESVMLINNIGDTIKKFEFYNTGYFVSEKLMQYLPEGKYDLATNLPNNPYILKGGYHIPFQDTSIYYDSIYFFHWLADSGYQISYIDNGVTAFIEDANCFINGSYIFSWQNDTLYALLNSEYLRNQAYYPPFGGIEYYCPPGYTEDQCDSLEQATYDDAKEQWERDMDDFLDAAYDISKGYFPHFSDSATHYFRIDTAQYFALLDSTLGDSTECYCGYALRPYYSADETTKRLRLDSIREVFGNSGIPSPAISFEYNSTKLPHFHTNDFDHWGYYNYDGELPNVSPIPYGSSVYGYSGAQAYEPAMKACILEQINYPYGGYVKYDYEANRARTNSAGTTSEVVGGLRLKSVERGTGSGAKYYTNYDYKLFKDTIINGVYTLDTTGIPSGNLLAYHTQYEVPVGYQIVSSSWDLVMTGVQDNVLPLLKTKSGYVGYSEVAVSKSDDEGNTLGRSLYRFYPVDTIAYFGASDQWGRPGASSVKFISPPKYSSLSGNLREKIVADKWDQILTKTVNKYVETEPNFFDQGTSENEAYYDPYIQSYTYMLELGSFVAFIDPVNYNNDYYYAFPKIPVLSSVHNYNYYPNEGLVSSDSSYYLYDTYQSQFYSPSLEIAGLVDAYDLSSNYVSGLDLYLDLGVYDYNIQCTNTHKPIFELRFDSNGEEIIKRYWYPSHLEDSDTVYEKLVDRNIISSPVKTETFLDTTRMEGQRTKFGVYSKEGSTSEDFILPYKTEQYFVDHYDPIQEFLKYDDFATPLEVQIVNGNKTSAVWRNRGKHKIAAIENAEYDEVIIQDFEQDTIGYGENWKIANQSYSTQEYTSTYAHTGHKAIKLTSVNSTSTSYIFAKKDTSEIDVNGKYTFTAWLKADTIDTSTPDIVIYYTTQSGTTQASRTIYDSNKKGEWQLLKVEMDLSDYSGVIEIEARVRNIGTNSVSCYIDDLRLFPSDALMTTYTYDPLIGKTSEIDPTGQTAIYEYDDFGRLWQIKDDDGNILKQHTYHFAE